MRLMGSHLPFGDVSLAIKVRPNFKVAQNVKKIDTVATNTSMTQVERGFQDMK